MADGYFDVMTSIISKKNVSEEDILKHFNGWQTIVWLGNHPRAVYEANVLNSCRGNKYIGKIQEYKALKGLIHLPRNTFLKNDKTDKHKKTIREVLTRHFRVGKMTAGEYYNILNGKQILDILELYARKNETHLAAKDIKLLKAIRDAIVAKKKTLKEKE